MPSNFHLKGLTIEAFRGFSSPAFFDLDASAVIFTGPNGTGKTSVFDALQWVLLGSIKRLEALRERPTVEHVVSKFRDGERARVSLTVDVGGEQLKLVRTGDRRGSTLEVSGASGLSLFGDGAAEWLDAALVPSEPGSLAGALTTCGLLQQDVMRSVLEAKPAERFAHISAVLGLGELESFETGAKDALKELNDRKGVADRSLLAARSTVAALQERIELLENRALSRASVEAVRSQLLNTQEEHSAFLDSPFPDDLTAGSAIAASVALRELSTRVESFSAARERAKTISESLPSRIADEEFGDLERRFANATTSAETSSVAVARLREQLSVAASAAEDVSRLAAAALPLLGDQCPVCGQSIDEAQVEARLSELASESETLVRLQAELEIAQNESRATGAELEVATKVLAAGEQTRERWANSDAEMAAADNVGRVLAREQVLRGSDGEWILENEAIVIQSLRQLSTLLERYSDVLSDTQATGELDRAKAELKSAASAAASRDDEAGAASVRAARMRQLSEASSEARLTVTKSRFDAIEPLVSDIYRRLDPHPAFKGFGFNHVVHYKKGTSTAVVSDPVTGIEADPLMVFSASQANIAALSYFLAMSLGAGDRSLPFVLLDDPLQSMDDVNVLGFADLCRFLRSQRQLVLSTHDRRFASLLRRKLNPRTAGERTAIFEFTGWDRRGPIVRAEVESFEPGVEPIRLLADSA